MQDKDNQLIKIITQVIEKKGLLKQECDLYKEFQSWDAVSSEKAFPNVISLFPMNDNKSGDPGPDNRISLAAQSESKAANKEMSIFYILPNFEIAVKFDKRNDKKIIACLISEGSSQIANSLLYCEQLNKYYLPDKNNEFDLGSLNYSELLKFSFKLLFPIDELLIRKNDSETTMVSRKNNIIAEKVIFQNNQFTIELEGTERTDKFIIISNGYIDFLEQINSGIRIPEVFLTNAAKILVYRISIWSLI